MWRPKKSPPAETAGGHGEKAVASILLGYCDSGPLGNPSLNRKINLAGALSAAAETVCIALFSAL
jgi:hypothetical protein